MGRVTIPFRSVFQSELNNLERSFRQALIDLKRGDAFDCLKKLGPASREP